MRFPLGFVLGLTLGACATALAADRADDYILVVDTDSTNGSVKRVLELTQHLPRDTASWSSERSAAATSLASWLSWCQTNDQPAYSWLTGLTSAQQEGLRQALLKGS